MRFAPTAVLLLLAGAACVAGAEEPADAALKFLDDLRRRTVPVEEVLAGSALSPYCGESKKEQITARLARLGRQLRREGAVLRVAGKRVDGSFAAVLVVADNPADPLDIKVHALGQRKDRGRWKVAPVLGTFDNAYVGFDEAVERRLAALEEWMSAERILRLQELHAAAEQRLRDRMKEAVAPEVLEQESPGGVVDAFAKACRARDLAAVLVILGDAVDDDAESRARVRSLVSNGLQGRDRGGRWELLTSERGVRVVADEESSGNEAEVTLLCYDPAESSPVRAVRFTLFRGAGRWHLELPDIFRGPAGPAIKVPGPGQLRDRGEMRKRFGHYFERAREPLRAATVQDAGVAIEGLLRAGDLDGLFRFLHRHPDLDDGERRIAYAEMAQLWKQFRDETTGGAEGLLVETLERGGAGVLVFNVVSNTHLDRMTMTPVLLLRDASGWAVAPGVTSRGNFDKLAETLRTEQAAVFADYTDRRGDLERQAASRFLERFATATPAPEGTAVEAEVREVVTGFRSLLRAGKLLQACSRCALLDRGDGAWEALKSLSYEHRGAKEADEPDHELTIQCDGPWAAVSLRVHAGRGGEPDYPMYLVVATADGPRIVVDAGLRLATNKGREILNKRVWERIEARLPAPQAGLVRGLFREHVAQSSRDRKEWLKNSTSSP